MRYPSGPRGWSAKPLFAGSNPARTSDFSLKFLLTLAVTLASVRGAFAEQGFSLREWRDPADYTQFAALERGGKQAAP